MARPRKTTSIPDTPPKAPPPIEAAAAFSIVGIGTSAGGLEALELFFRDVPIDSGRAFVVVQHLDPTHEGMLVELLQRMTPIAVVQATEGLRVTPDRIHVIPPNRDLSIRAGVLHLLTPAEPRGLRLPIDAFFRALAEDVGPRAVAVVLSGMGSDGSLGIAAIKARGGAVFVQSAETAKFDGMPRSAITTGLADVIAPVETLAARIFGHHPPLDTSGDEAVSPAVHAAIERACVLLRKATGHEFSQYKRSTILRRIERRMGLHQLDTIDGYVRYLQENPEETKLLFKELLIGVTRFFRDPPAWELLRRVAIPRLLAERSDGGLVRAWVPGCSTGEEAYSLAIVLDEALAELGPGPRLTVQIFATDLDKDAIDRARIGRYPASIAADVSAERLARYFVQDDHGVRVCQEIRERIIFAVQNVIMDPPFTKLDMVSCRNLLIYLSADLQHRLLPTFHFGLNRGGILFLGSSETVGASADSFEAIDAKARIYRRNDASSAARPLDFPSAFTVRPPDGATARAQTVGNLQDAAERLILARFGPALVLTNRQGDILYVHGRTGRYLEPAAGKANWNIHSMAREGLRSELGAGLSRAFRDKTPVSLHALHPEHDDRPVDVSLEVLHEPAELRDMVMIAFTDRPAAPAVAPPSKQGRSSAIVAKLELELQTTREALQSTREAMQSSTEERTSANEELQSTNEELQSTNEELTTSKEEMQSLNEELQTLNAELQSKLDELSRTNDDMRNLLDSTDIATLFLDDQLQVRRFTPQMLKIIKLLPGDVHRPITDLASDLVYPRLVDDAREVLRTLVFRETPVTTTDGRWFNVRIMPYRTLGNRIDGVVITFVDISAAKALEAELRKAHAGRQAQP